MEVTEVGSHRVGDWWLMNPSLVQLNLLPISVLTGSQFLNPYSALHSLRSVFQAESASCVPGGENLGIFLLPSRFLVPQAGSSSRWAAWRCPEEQGGEPGPGPCPQPGEQPGPSGGDGQTVPGVRLLQPQRALDSISFLRHFQAACKWFREAETCFTGQVLRKRSRKQIWLGRDLPWEGRRRRGR